MAGAEQGRQREFGRRPRRTVGRPKHLRLRHHHTVRDLPTCLYGKEAGKSRRGSTAPISAPGKGLIPAASIARTKCSSASLAYDVRSA